MNSDTPPLPFADFDRWVTESWQTEQRYYQADIIQDLFGTWLVKRSWGGLGSRRGNSKTHAVTTYEDALQLIKEVSQKRQKRGYICVS